MIHDAELKKRRHSRRHSLCLEDQLLLTLNYLRMYATQLSLSAYYGVAESNVNRTIYKIEKILVKSRRFSLPQKGSSDRR
ncbi:transposase family protein [Acinetobacter nectaris]|nr:transposase family protein [Acinetobacter nectaris]